METSNILTHGTSAQPRNCAGNLPQPETGGFTITSVLYAPLKRAQRDSGAKTAKRDVFPRVNRKNASGTFSARCMTMHETEWRSVWTRPLSLRLIFGCFRPPASFFRLLLVARSSTVTVPASQCWIQHRSTVSSTPPIKSGTVSSTVKGKSSHNPAP